MFFVLCYNEHYVKQIILITSVEILSSVSEKMAFDKALLILLENPLEIALFLI